MKNTEPNKKINTVCNASCSCGDISQIFQLIDITAKKLKKIQQETVGKVGITPTQYYILSLLWQKNERPLHELAHAFSCTGATMTGIVDTLEKNKLAERVPNPDDRRSFLVKLSEKGKGLEKTIPTMEKIFGNCCTAISPSEFGQLYSILTKFNSSLDSENPERKIL